MIKFYAVKEALCCFAVIPIRREGSSSKHFQLVLLKEDFSLRIEMTTQPAIVKFDRHFVSLQQMEQEIIENLRRDYRSATLSEADVNPNPIRQFEKWFNEAINAKLYEPNAMTLATATTDGRPSARIVLLKGFSENGFKFYTNYLSRKGKELTKNPLASLILYWPEMERQIRIEGTIEKLSKEYSSTYFHSRPKGSQIGAVVSPQSQEIASREELEQKWQQLEQEYENKEVPKPAHWGGYIVKPRLIEFWQGRSSRLHDRILYKKADQQNWKIVRLAP